MIYALLAYLTAGWTMEVGGWRLADGGWGRYSVSSPTFGI